MAKIEHCMTLDFQLKEPPLPLQFQKAICVVGMDIFWNHSL